MKNKKIVIFTMSFVLSLFLTGCTNKAEKTEFKPITDYKIDMTKPIDFSKLIGEWYGKSFGHIIFKEDCTYEWYINEEDVQVGTYEIDRDEPRILLNAKYIIYDGEKIEGSSSTEYCLSVKDITMKIINLKTHELYSLNRTTLKNTYI